MNTSVFNGAVSGVRTFILVGLVREPGRRSTGAAYADFARACTVGGHHDALPFHLLNHSGGAVITDSKPPLNHRDRCLPCFEHNTQSFVVEFISPIARAGCIIVTRSGVFENFHLIVGRTLVAQEIAYLPDFNLGNKGAMQAAQLGGAGW